MSPWSTSVAMRLPRAAVTSSASLFVCVKQMALAPLPYTVTRSARMVVLLVWEHAQDMTSMVSATFCSWDPTRSIVTWSARYFWVMRVTHDGIVAEKRKVCLCSGISSMMRSTSSSNPTASIWSASSRTQYSMSWRLREPRWMRSMSRPGVPTTMSTPRRSGRSWLEMATPP